MERARFKAYLEAFEQQLRDEGKSANTLTSYTRDVREFLGFLASGPYGETIDELTENHIAAFIASLQGRELAQRSKAKKLTSIRSFLLFCRRNNLLRAYPPKLTFAKIKPLVAEILADQERAAHASHTDTNGYAQLRNTRRFIRVPFYGEVRLKPRSSPDEEWYLGYAFDLGRGGLGVSAAFKGHESLVEVVFELDGESIHAQGRVAFLDANHPDFEKTKTHRVGVEFTQISGEDLARLTRYVAARLVNGHVQEPEETERVAQGQNTRQFVRIPFQGDTRLRAPNGDYQGVTVDLGVNGVSVQMGECLIDDRTPLRLELALGGATVDVGGRIVNRTELRVTDGETGATRQITRLGIQFTEVDDHAATAIARYIRDHLTRAVPAPAAALSA